MGESVNFSIRRRYPRLEVAARVHYKSENLDIEEETHDLSLGGMFLSCGLLDPVGTPARIRLVFPDGDAEVEGAAVVRWTTLDPRGPDQALGDRNGMGLEFAINAEDMKRGLVYYYGRKLLPTYSA